jgi:hypothetical protein
MTRVQQNVPMSSKIPYSDLLTKSSHLVPLAKFQPVNLAKEKVNWLTQNTRLSECILEYCILHYGKKQSNIPRVGGLCDTVMN